jgi:hypothetical protein
MYHAVHALRHAGEGRSDLGGKGRHPFRAILPAEIADTLNVARLTMPDTETRTGITSADFPYPQNQT